MSKKNRNKQTDQQVAVGELPPSGQSLPTTNSASSPTSSGSTSTKPTVSTYKECHKGNVKVLSITGHGGLYCGGWSRSAKSTGFAVIDLTGTEKPFSSEIKGLNDAGKAAFAEVIALNAYEEADPWLSLKIKDFGVPTFADETWPALAKAVEKLMNEDKNVLVCCQGGHGRTGMAATILIGLIFPDLGQDPLEYLRSVYCNDAVETLEQHKYVNRILGLPAPKPGIYYKHDAYKKSSSPAVGGAWGGNYGGGGYYGTGYGGYLGQDGWHKWESDPTPAPAKSEKLTGEFQDTENEQVMVEEFETRGIEYTLKVGTKKNQIDYEVCILSGADILYFKVIKYNPADKSVRCVSEVGNTERWIPIENLATIDQANAYYDAKGIMA